MPDFPAVTPDPDSPLLISTILSLTCKVLESTTVVVPLTVKFPVTVKLSTCTPPVAAIEPVKLILGALISACVFAVIEAFAPCPEAIHFNICS